MHRTKHIILLLVLVMFTSKIDAQELKKPKLVIGIVLENFNPEYFIKYKSQFSSEGIGRFINGGACFRNTQYPYYYSQTGVDQASIYSGCTPSEHGVISHAWYNQFEKKAIDNTYDKEFIVSPNKMLISSVGDILKKTNSCSRVFGVGANAESAVFSSGHMSDGAFWLNNDDGKWATSSYYMDSLSNWARDYNKHLNVDYYIKRGWYPLSQENPDISYRLGMSKNFYYNLSKLKRETGNYKILKATPYVNRIITEFAKELIINENLGKDSDSDILSLSYSFLDYMNDEYDSDAEEKLDMMYRLDREFVDLFKFIDLQIGMENTLVFITVSQAMTTSPKELKKQKLPGGYFSSFKAVSLLKPYLNITYGPQDWIVGYDSQQIFLNRNLIEKKKLDLKEVQDKSVDFLIQFAGANKVLSSHVLKSCVFTNGVEQKMQRSFNQKRSGDILISLSQGWVNELHDREDFISKYSYLSSVPLFWYGCQVQKKNVNSRASILDIVPTLSDVLDIPINQSVDGKILPIR